MAEPPVPSWVSSLDALVPTVCEGARPSLGAGEPAVAVGVHAKLREHTCPQRDQAEKEPVRRYRSITFPIDRCRRSTQHPRQEHQ